MASRKEQKDAARQARLAAEQAKAAQAARTRRLGIIGGVVVVAVIVVVVAIVVSSGGGSKDSSTTSNGLATGAKASATYDAVATELKGIPQSGTTLGKASAPITVQYFGDLECPYCAELTVGEADSGLPQFITTDVKQGKAKLVYRSMETATSGSNADRWYPQQVAAYAAGKQNLFWDYAELFYHEQQSEDDHYVTESFLTGLAKQIPDLNIATWQKDRNDSSLRAQVTADGKKASAYALQGTPTLVITGKKGSAIAPSTAGVSTYDQIESTIKSVS